MRTPQPLRPPSATASLVLALALTACGAGGPSDAGRAPAADTFAVTDTVITTESAMIGGVTDMNFGPDGRLYLADRMLKQVLSIRPDGGDARTFGREGDGPGEFSTPWSIAAGADRVWVFDMGRGDVQAFSSAGDYRDGYAVGAGSFGRGRTLSPHGSLAYATGGRDSVLVGVVDDAGETVRSFGDPIAPEVPGWNFTSMKARIADGEVPDEFRNDALPVWAPDGSLYVVFYSEPEVRRYGPAGELEWTHPLEDPTLERTLEAFFRSNREERDPTRIVSLLYPRDARAVDGDLWVLLNTLDEDDGVVLAFDGGDGGLRRRMILRGLPGGGPFAVDRRGEHMYVVVGEEAMLVRLDLEEDDVVAAAGVAPARERVGQGPIASDVEREDRVVLVTGSTSGLGREVALRLGAEGAHVIVHGRDRERGLEVVERIERDGPGSARFYRADFGSLADVRELADAILRDYDRLDVLVNNAGIWLRDTDERPLSEDGHELHFQVNYLAGYLLTHLLLPRLEASSPARIVNVASAAQRPIDFDDVMLEEGYSGSRAYAQSKLAQVIFTVDLARALEGAGVTVNALHPATLMNTAMVREAGVRARSTVEEGAEAVMHLIEAPDLGSGGYFDGTRPARANAQAYDEEAGRRLRELSRRLVGLD
ncbi:MAG: SDR family NAD(P)-dependent oxidoreductase [Gemmatimonadota bacterium]